MKIQININEEVETNTNYITCEKGEFEPNNFVFYKQKTESNNNTVMFLVSQIKN